jgi:hypothetical protein
MRRKAPVVVDAPFEVGLAINVTDCSTCAFFWPTDGDTQPYGPFTSFAAPSADKGGDDPAPSVETFAWIRTATTAPAFPDPAILAGCRKAPIMTVGINPNLTAVAPGRQGAEWAYPSFIGSNADRWARYAAYYRYRTVFQERLTLSAVHEFVAPEGHVVAPKPGVVTDRTVRTSSSASFDLVVRYDGDTTDTTIRLDGEAGGAQWVVLFDVSSPHDRFTAGDVIAAKLLVPADHVVEVHRQRVGYYEQFVPVLEAFDQFIRTKGFTGASLRMGEDVGQIDMVACASPRWTPDYLGGTATSENGVIHNCVNTNAWAISQIVHTQPAVIYLVGESSYRMFAEALGAHLIRDPPLPHNPSDGAFTLLAATTDPGHPCHLEWAGAIDGISYQVRSRVVISPHFSYPTNFIPQIRLTKSDWIALTRHHQSVASLLTGDHRVALTVPDNDHQFVVAALSDPRATFAAVEAADATGAAILRAGFYDPHHMLGSVLEDVYTHGELTITTTASKQSVLTRSMGGCKFCVNDHWSFPQGCPYNKPDEPQLPAGFLAAVTRQLIATGRPAAAPASHGPMNAPTRLTVARKPTLQ